MKHLEYLALGIVGLFVASMAIGGLAGQPVLLGYVESGSMAPTLETNDGFVAVPAVLSSEVEAGDVVVFEARRIRDGELTTHRVVAVTQRGYVTKGDANPSTDQAAGEPPVQDAQIRATALQVGGEVVVVPKLGLVSGGIHALLAGVQRRLAATFGTDLFLGGTGVALLVMAAGGLLVLSDLLADRRRLRDVGRSRRRDGVYDARRTAMAVAVAVLVVSSGAMVVASSTVEYPLVSSATGSDRYNVVEAGTSTVVTYTLHNGPVPMYSIAEVDGDHAAVEEDVRYLGPNAAVDATVSVTAPEETGVYPQYVVERRYFAVLPRSTTAALAAAHPLLPVLLIGGLLGLASMALTFLALGVGVVRVRDASRS